MRMRFSDIICANTKIQAIQPNVFLLENPETNPMEPCNNPGRPSLDINLIASQANQRPNPSIN